MSALIYLVDTLLLVALFFVLARLLLQWTRADFRNPLCQAVVRLTNPLILPLRRVLPPVGKVDSASVVAVLLVAFVKVASYFALNEPAPPAVFWVREMAIEIAEAVLSMYFWAIIVYALLGLIAPSGISPLQSLLASFCEPVLRPLRRLIPPMAGIDFSPLWACILIRALMILLQNFI